jgi:hypothetical protein
LKPAQKARIMNPFTCRLLARRKNRRTFGCGGFFVPALAGAAGTGGCPRAVVPEPYRRLLERLCQFAAPKWTQVIAVACCPPVIWPEMKRTRTPPTDVVQALKADLVDARELLLTHGDKAIAGRLAELLQRLAGGDRGAILSVIAEATGGMGSLNDRVLSAASGDAIEPWQETRVNQQLGALVRSIQDHAEAARAAAWRGGGR